MAKPDERTNIHDALAHIHMLCDEGDPVEALRYVEEVTGHPLEVQQLRAMAEIDAGEKLADRAIIARGVARYERLEQDLQSTIVAYNRANGLVCMWEIAVQEFGVARALAEHRGDLQQARDLFARAGADDELDQANRCQALTNLGNSMDACGRHVDAIVAYDQALAIRPDFAMALGNRGTTFMRRAAVDDLHQPALVSEAAASLDAALANPDEILAHGGPSALASFQRKRAQIDGTPTHHHDQEPLSDTYLEWCLQHELFLHSSHRCIGPSTKVLDSLRVGRILIGTSKPAQRRHTTLQDALNSLLQDYIAARYLSWMSLDSAAPTRQHAAELSKHASFYDSLTYARWGVATGMSVSALAAATNLLDKVASVTHQYLRTGRAPSRIYFKGFWLQSKKKNTPDQPNAAIAAELDAGNHGLLALADLSGELERASPLNALISRRHAATHRTVAVHHMLVDDIDDAGWLDRITGDDLRDALLAQLARARAALLYLADVINDHERVNGPVGAVLTMPSWPAIPERAEDW